MTQPRLIRLDQWLQIMFGDNPPTRVRLALLARGQAVVFERCAILT